MMDCGWREAIIHEYHDGTLAGADREAAETHVRECDGCASLLRELAMLDRAAAAPALPDVPDARWAVMWNSISDVIAESPPRRRLLTLPRLGAFTPMRALAAAATFVIVFVGIFYMTNRPPNGMTPPPPIAAGGPSCIVDMVESDLTNAMPMTFAADSDNDMTIIWIVTDDEDEPQNTI